jgi:hypothetical protein
MRSAFEEARTRAGSTPLHMLVGSRRVMIEFASPELHRRFTPALTPLAVEAGADPELTILCWDRESTGVPAPRSPWGLGDFRRKNGRVRGEVDEQVLVAYQQFVGLLHVYDRDRREGSMFTPSPADVPAWVDRAPFRHVFSWWTSDNGMALLHAAGVASDAGAALLAGASGAGKSTTAMSCLSHGMRFISDDACVVTCGDRNVVHPLYGRLKLESDAVARLGIDVADETLQGTGQALVVPEVDRSGPDLRAILLLTVGPAQDTTWKRVGRPEALRRLMSTSMSEGGWVTRGGVSSLTRLVKAVPCYDVTLGSEVSGVVDAVATLINRG